MPIAIALAALALLGVLLALFGRRKPTPPRCAKCNFDTTGLLPVPPHADARCPECGKALTTERDFIVNNVPVKHLGK